MDLQKTRKKGNNLMLTGAGIFGIGLATSTTANFIEKSNTAHQKKQMMLAEDVRDLKVRHEQEARRRSLELEEKRLNNERISRMNDSEYAQHLAERNARASKEAIEKAERIQAATRLEMAELRIKCEEDIAKVRDDCARKVEDANRRRDKAEEKYEMIDALFTNRNKILRAKEDLDRFVNQSSSNNVKAEELKKEIKILL